MGYAMQTTLGVDEMKLFIDDVDPIPPGWVGARSIGDAAHMMRTQFFTAISFDNDMGEEKEGADLANWLEQKLATGEFNKERFKNCVFTVHSSNPAACVRIEQALTKIRNLISE